MYLHTHSDPQVRMKIVYEVTTLVNLSVLISEGFGQTIGDVSAHQSLNVLKGYLFTHITFMELDTITISLPEC